MLWVSVMNKTLTFWNSLGCNYFTTCRVRCIHTYTHPTPHTHYTETPHIPYTHHKHHTRRKCISHTTGTMHTTPYTYTHHTHTHQTHTDTNIQLIFTISYTENGINNVNTNIKKATKLKIINVLIPLFQRVFLQPHFNVFHETQIDWTLISYQTLLLAWRIQQRTKVENL
jgi:hypothetical protein